MKSMLRLFRIRGGEPLHLSILSAFAWFGHRQRVNWDNVQRPHYAFSILYAADQARRRGLKAVTIIEFGVASGAGLRVMHRHAAKTTAITGIDFRIVAFDTAAGLPPPARLPRQSRTVSGR